MNTVFSVPGLVLDARRWDGVRSSQLREMLVDLRIDMSVNVPLREVNNQPPWGHFLFTQCALGMNPDRHRKGRRLIVHNSMFMLVAEGYTYRFIVL